MNYLRVALGSTSTRKFDPSVEENKNLLLKLQRERQFGQIGHAWIDQMNAQGPLLIEKLGNLLLDTNKLRESMSSYQTSMHNALESLTKQLALVQEVIYMKINVMVRVKWLNVMLK